MNLDKINIKLKKDNYKKIRVNNSDCVGCMYISKNDKCVFEIKSTKGAALVGCLVNQYTKNPIYYIFKFSLENILNKL